MSIAQSSRPPLTVSPHRAARRGQAGITAVVCGGLLALLMVWAVAFPQTGDGDAIMHYLNARDGLWEPAKLLGSWARIGAKIPLLIPAQFGILPARWMSAIISVICAWQTIRLADDLGIKRAWLAAPMLIFQPFVFTLAGDTMTELPLALGIVIAIRLWLARRVWTSCLVMGYLPTVRPEGFFLCALWAAMVIGTESAGPWRKRAANVLMLGWGTLAWLVACWIVHRNVHYFFTDWWAWPAESMRIYGHGSFFAYPNRWPLYCGPVLFPLFVLGMIRSPGCTSGAASGAGNVVLLASGGALLILETTLGPEIRENVLPWAAFLLAGAIAWSVRREKLAVCVWVFVLIFTLHSVLWWRGWFGSCGLMRILACVGPITAIICLRGWNFVADRLSGFHRTLGVAGIAAMGLTAMGYYLVEPTHQRIFPLQRACEFVTKTGLLANVPKIILGDPMAQVSLHMGPNPSNVMANQCNRAGECKRLLDVPIGSAGLWDNQHAQAWFHVSPADLPTLGYSVLFEARQRPAIAIEWLEPANLPRQQIYLVIRKDRAGEMPPDVAH